MSNVYTAILECIDMLQLLQEIIDKWQKFQDEWIYFNGLIILENII